MMEYTPDGSYAERAWPAPAKLNLMLRVVGRRADGYHLLQTVFQFIDCCDDLTFRLRDDGEIHLLAPLVGVPQERDLTVRAARLLQQRAGVPWGVDIAVTKRLPIGGGLGGGSSDAATTLAVLNRLWGVRWPGAVLQELGLQLGADVPVFLFGHSAWGEGVGERLTRIDVPESWYVVVVPECHVPTAQIFGQPDLTRNNEAIRIADFVSGDQANDCVPVVCRLFPPVHAAMQALKRFATPRLTGTGACVFAAFASHGEARAVLEQLVPAFTAFVARGVNQSPLFRMLGTGQE